jgi:type 1 glutamine amidotransferase
MKHLKSSLFIIRKLQFLIAALLLPSLLTALSPVKPVRILVITGGHAYKTEQFNQMLASLAPEIVFQVAELPAAFDMFLPENRSKYDVLVFYHMWQTITPEQEKNVADCIKNGKPVVVLHHSICAFDDWPEYWNIIGGKYFHKATTFRGEEYQPCSYIHDLHFNVKVVDPKNPVTHGVDDFPIFDETYKGYYVADGVTPILTTDEPSSTPVIGWTKKYGKARIVVLQSGHDVPTFENENFRKLLRQAIEWVNKK